MSGYRNTLQYPGVKRAGAQLQCHGVGAPGLGIEAVVGDLQDLETGGPLVGLRVSHRPAGGFEVGATWVVDLDQYVGLRDADGDGYPDAVDAFPRDASRALDNDGDGVADEVDGDDDNDGRFDVDPGSGLPADLRAALDTLSVRYGEVALPLQHQLPRRRPFNRHRVGRDGFGAFGVDAAYPLVRRPDRELAVYAQMAVYLDDRDDLDPAAADAQGVTPGNRRASGFGLAAPGIRARAGPIAGQLELRYCARDFVAGYFGELYDLDRVRLDLASGRATPKDAGLQRRGGRAGAFGSATANLRDLLEATGEYEFLAGSPSAQRLQAGAALSPRLVRLVPRLEEARAYYRKDDIGRRGEGFLEPSEDTFYGYAFGVQVAAGVSVRWDTRYVYVRRADARLQRQKTMTVETVFTL
jgi:hypothetical protein